METGVSGVGSGNLVLEVGGRGGSLTGCPTEGTAGGSLGRKGGTAGPDGGMPSVGPWVVTGPPLTNRGVLLPSVGRPDFVKVTVWAEVAAVQEALEWRFLDLWAGSEFVGWSEGSHGGRVASSLEAASGLVKLLTYHGQDGGVAGYLSVEVTGKGCERLGNEGVSDLLQVFVGRRWRWRMSRLDVCWDRVPFTPGQVYRAVVRGDVASAAHSLVNSEGVGGGKGDAEWLQNAAGRTVYVGKRRRCYFGRCYDRRGPVRYEVEMKHAAAEGVGEQMVSPAWPWR